MHKLKTDLTLSFGGYEKTFSPLVVEYTHVKAFNGGRSEPSHAEHVELGLVYVDRDGAPDPLPEWMIEGITADLERLCLEDWRAEEAYAHAYAAERRRELDAVKVAAK